MVNVTDKAFNKIRDLIVEENKIELDEDELITFLNEYYTINQDSIPKSELY